MAKSLDTAVIEAALARHDKIALQFSGGRDSIALLWLMRPYWDRLTVYWLNTGDTFPETRAVIDQVRGLVPRFAEIESSQSDVVAQFGVPSDIVPVSRTPIGLLGECSTAPQIQDRYSCCARTIMLPMHQRMVDDGITLIIRGQKNADRLKAPLNSGDVDLGIEYLFPLEDWTNREVTAFIHEAGAPMPRFYQILSSAPDCMTCSAWWENGVAAYLKRYHHEHYEEVQRRLDVINAAVADHIANFNKEVNT